MKMKINSKQIKIKQNTDYPWSGKVDIEISPEDTAEFTFGFRIPGWSDDFQVKINQKEIKPEIENGYARIKRKWEKGDNISINFSIEVKRIYSNPKIRENAGKVALQRGPVVYCLEEVDNGSNLASIVLPQDANILGEFNKELLGGIYELKAEAYRSNNESDELYTSQKPELKKTKIKAIPYYAWNNRGPGEMRVWLRQG